MRTFVTIGILCFALLGCSESERLDNMKTDNIGNRIKIIDGRNLFYVQVYVIEYDSIEYMITSNGGIVRITKENSNGTL